jgi:hypothetical protein
LILLPLHTDVRVDDQASVTWIYVIRAIWGFHSRSQSRDETSVLEIKVVGWLVVVMVVVFQLVGCMESELSTLSPTPSGFTDFLQ